MASFVWLNGFMGSKIRDNVRIIRIDSLKRRNSNDVKFEDIPCVYWNRLSNNEMTRLSEGSFVSIKGRIESDDDIGAYILVEALEHLLPPPKNTNLF